MKVKTSELSGVQLDVAVALAIGGHITRSQDAQVYLNGMHQLCGEENKRHSRYVFSPSTNWSQCGPLIEQFDLLLNRIAPSNEHWRVSPHNSWSSAVDKNLMVAICRAVVAAKLGDEVDIPDELMEATR